MERTVGTGRGRDVRVQIGPLVGTLLSLNSTGAGKPSVPPSDLPGLIIHPLHLRDPNTLSASPDRTWGNLRKTGRA